MVWFVIHNGSIHITFGNNHATMYMLFSKPPTMSFERPSAQSEVSHPEASHSDREGIEMISQEELEELRRRQDREEESMRTVGELSPRARKELRKVLEKARTQNKEDDES